MVKETCCPFPINPPKEDEFGDKDRFISFKQPINPNNANGIKLTHKAKVCESTFIEDILQHELQFSQLQLQMNLNNITDRKAVYEATLSPSLLTTWRQACTQAPVNANYQPMNLLQFASAREEFVLKASSCS